MGKHGRNYVNGKGWAWINNQYIEEAKYAHKELDGAGIIGANNAMPQMIWKRYFLEAQGYGIDDNVLY